MSSLAFTVTVNVGTAVTGVEDGLLVGVAQGDFEGFIVGRLIEGEMVGSTIGACVGSGFDAQLDITGSQKLLSLQLNPPLQHVLFLQS
jgi:hypothetical protein